MKRQAQIEISLHLAHTAFNRSDTVKSFPGVVFVQISCDALLSVEVGGSTDVVEPDSTESEPDNPNNSVSVRSESSSEGAIRNATAAARDPVEIIFES